MHLLNIFLKIYLLEKKYNKLSAQYLFVVLKPAKKNFSNFILPTYRLKNTLLLKE